MRRFQLAVFLLTNALLATLSLFDFTPQTHNLMQNFALVAACLMSLCAFAEPELSRRLNFVWSGWVAIFVVLLQEPSMRSGMMLTACFALTQATYLIAVMLTAKMEHLEQKRFVIGSSRGIVQRLPQHTGLMQVILLLLCCIPGSAFFFIEDMAIEGMLDHSWFAVCVVLFSNTIIAIGLWNAFTDIFLGRHTTEQASLEESGLVPYRAAIAVLLGLNLMPFLWAA